MGVRRFGTDGADEARGVAARDGVTVIGPGVGSFDLFVFGVTPDGTRRWLAELGSCEDDHPEAVAVDACGRVVVVGYTVGDLGGTTPLGGRDAFVWAFDPPAAAR